MSPSILAQIVDIRADTPTTSDRFFVDTNAWYWLSYTRASQTPASPQSYQLTDYPEFLKKALSAKAKLHCCALSFPELAHNIEKAEREIYADQAGRDINPKEFRHKYTRQHNRVVRLIIDTWSDVLAISSQLDITLDSAFMSEALSMFSIVGVDGYDLFMVEGIRRHNITQIVTDDGDYATVQGITVFTANPRLIQMAQSAGKLIVR